VKRWLRKFDITRQDPEYWDQSWLREKYVNRGLSTVEIGDIADVSATTIERWLRKHGIETRRGPEASEEILEETIRDPDWLRQKYWMEGLTSAEIGEIVGCCGSFIRGRMEEFGIPRNQGPRAPASLITRKRGYERWQDGPRESNRSVMVHQLLAIAEGADPAKIFSNGDYHVHHKNNIPWDNRPENIELLEAGEHQDVHARGEHLDAV